MGAAVGQLHPRGESHEWLQGPCHYPILIHDLARGCSAESRPYEEKRIKVCNLRPMIWTDSCCEGLHCSLFHLCLKYIESELDESYEGWSESAFVFF